MDKDVGSAQVQLETTEMPSTPSSTDPHVEDTRAVKNLKPARRFVHMAASPSNPLYMESDRLNPK